MTTKSKREELFDLTDNVVDAILNMSDEEIFADLEEDGITAEDAGRAFDSLLDSARMKAGRKALVRVRDEMNAARQASSHGRVFTAVEARSIVERTAREQRLHDRLYLDAGIDTNDIAIAVPEVDVGIGDLEAGVRLSRTMGDGLSGQYLELDGIFALAGDTERDDRLRLGTGLTVPEPWFGGILDLGLRLDGLHGDDWQTYGLKFGYSLEPHWLPGSVDMGLSFDGLGVEDVDFGSVRSCRWRPDSSYSG